MTRSHVTSHVLDTVTGRPVTGIGVSLEHLGEDGWVPLAIAATDGDGRVKHLGDETLAAGTYRVRFATGDWYAESGTPTFFPEVIVPFFIADDEPHVHLPLLLSPFAYSTYRGS